MVEERGSKKKAAVELANLVDGRALRNALAPLTAMQEAMNAQMAAFKSIRALAGASYSSEIVKMVRIPDAYRFPEKGAIALQPDLTGLKALGATDTISHMLEGVRAQQSAFEFAISAYIDQPRAQAERFTAIIDALAIRRFNPATLGMGNVLALGETNAFEIAGLPPDYAQQFRSITGAVNERINAFAGLMSAEKTIAPQPDLVSGIGTLLARALAQQEAILGQQSELVGDIQPRRQTLIAERLTIIAAITTILYTVLCLYVMFEERLAGGDAAALADTAAIEDNTQMIGQMRDAFDSLADQLERMRSTQEEASEKEQAADAAIAGILRDIANTLTEQENVQEVDPDRSRTDDPS